MRIQNNIAAMTAHRNMSVANAGNARSQEKLSSGLRINRAGDDAAGLSISEKMRGQIRGLNQASRNAQDGISLIQTAEGALNETQNILQRMRELAVQSSNDTNTMSDREAIGAEIAQLFEEIDRIAETTQFNEMNLLDGNFGCTAGAAVTIAAIPSAALTTERVDSIMSELNNQLVVLDYANIGDMDSDLIAAAFDQLDRADIIAALTLSNADGELIIPAAANWGAFMDAVEEEGSSWQSFVTAVETAISAGYRDYAIDAVATLIRSEILDALENLVTDPASTPEEDSLEAVLLGLGSNATADLFGNGSGYVTNDDNIHDDFRLDFDFNSQSVADFIGNVADALSTQPPNPAISERLEAIQSALDGLTAASLSGEAIGVMDANGNLESATSARIDTELLNLLFDEVAADVNLAFINDIFGGAAIAAGDAAGMTGATTWTGFLDAVATASATLTDGATNYQNAVLDAVGALMQGHLDAALSAVAENRGADPTDDIQVAIANLNANGTAALLGTAGSSVNSVITNSGDPNFNVDFNFTGGEGAQSLTGFLNSIDTIVTLDLPQGEANMSTADRLAASNAERKFHIGANAGQQVAIAIADSTANALFGTTESPDAEAAAATVINDANANAAERILSMVRFSDGSENAAVGNEGASLADAVISAITSTEAFAMTTGDNQFEMSIADARNLAISAIEHAIGAVSERRSDLGALQNRLEHTIRNLDVASENLLSAEARIRDVDMASEVMEQTRTNILQQAAQSMLAMANQQPQSVLQLLG